MELIEASALSIALLFVCLGMGVVFRHDGLKPAITPEKERRVNLAAYPSAFPVLVLVLVLNVKMALLSYQSNTRCVYSVIGSSP